MERIRIGNDIELRWKIYTTDAEGASSPYDLTGKALEVSLFNAYADGEVPLDFTTQENEITAIYRGKDQKVTGRYSIILRENNGADGMKTVDEHDAFELVCRTMDESRNDDGDVKCYHLSFQSTLSLGGGSIDLSAYAKQEDVDAALELKVDKVVGKGLSSNDYTDADKLKLTGLENYDDTQIRGLIAGKANLQHQHTVADITDFPELYYDATEILSSDTFTIEQFDELYDAILSKKIIYTYKNDGSYLVFQPYTWIEFSSRVIELTAACREGNKSVLTSFILYPYEGNDVRKFKAYVPANTSELTNDSGFITDSDITGKADKATTLAGYGIADAYTKSEVDNALEEKQDKITIFTETEGLSSYSINPNTLTKLGTLASSVTLSLNTASEEAGVVNVYDIIFSTPTNAPSITWPEGITWVGGSAPAIAGGKTYEINIMDNLAIYGEF